MSIDQNGNPIPDLFERFSNLRADLDTRLVGQNSAKDWISRVTAEHEMGVELPEGYPRVVMLAGDTGSGKTELFRTLSDILSVPFIRQNANELSHTAFKGKQISDIVQSLISEAGQATALRRNHGFSKEELEEEVETWQESSMKSKLDRVANGIVLIDEIDKIAFRRGNSDDVQERHFEAVQASLLPIFEGKRLMVDDRHDSFDFDSSRLLLFAAGAFKDDRMARIVRDRLGSAENLTKGYWHHITHEDLIQFGFMPELVGRLRAVVALDKFTGKMMETALGRYLQRYRIPGTSINLALSEHGVSVLSSRASELNIGARGIGVIIEEVVLHVYQKREGISIGNGRASISDEYIAKYWPDSFD